MCITKLLAEHTKYETVRISISGKRFKALVADTFLKRAIGLMYRNGLRRSECMLFIFDRPSREGIWMANMRFAIDIVWVGSNLEVVDILKRAKPCSSMFDCPTNYPKQSALYVVEFAAGAVDRFGIKKNQKLKIGKKNKK
jgi:hypothetical protein